MNYCGGDYVIEKMNKSTNENENFALRNYYYYYNEYKYIFTLSFKYKYPTVIVWVPQYYKFFKRKKNTKINEQPNIYIRKFIL